MQNTTLQGHQQAKYVYSANSYTGQQGAAPSSAASGAYAQQSYSQQPYAQQNYVQQVQSQGAVSQPAYGNSTTYGTLGGGSQTQSAQAQAIAWSQQASAATSQPSQQQQTAYGRSSTGVASSASGGGSSAGTGQYGGQYGSLYGTTVQGSNQQLLGSSRGVASPDFQAQGTAGSRGTGAYGNGQDRGLNTGASYVVGGTASVNAQGIYGAEAPKYEDTDKYGTGASSASYDGKGAEYGASSPSGYSQKAGDQYGNNYNIKTSDYSQTDRAPYGQNQTAYVQAETQGGAQSRRYHETHAAIAAAQQRQVQQQQQHQQQQQQDRQDQQLLRQQALQVQQAQAQAQAQAAAALLSRGSTSSVIDGGSRNQGDFLGGSRAVSARGSGSQEYTGQVRGLLGPSYGGNRSDADAGLLVSQYGGAGGRTAGAASSLPYAAQQAAMYGALNAGRGMIGQLYPHNAPVVGYGGVQLPPGREYSAGRGTGGGGYIAGGSRSDRPSIGSSRFEDRRDDRQPPRRDGGREDRRGGGRDRERDRFRNRDRERDTYRDRRDEMRKRERSPFRPGRDHKDVLPSKRDDRSSSRKESPRRDLQHRMMSPVKEKRRDYVCKVEQYSFVEAERDYAAVCKRYAKLYVVPEFSKLVVTWLEKDAKILLNQPVSFEHDAVEVEDDIESEEVLLKSLDKVSPSSATDQTKATKWNSKVMLMGGYNDAAFVELLSDTSVEDKPPHLHNLLKFVALRKDRGAIMATGGAWVEDLDGQDPAANEEVLIRTAIRCTKQATQLDLSGCTSWTRFLEVHYERLGENGLPSHNDVTVIFIPNLSQVLPSLEDWQLQWSHWKQSKLNRESTKAEKVQETKLEDSKSAGVEDGSTVAVEEPAPVSDRDAEDRALRKDDGVEEKLLVRQEESEGKPIEAAKETSVKVDEQAQQPGLFLTTKRTRTTTMRSMTISLDGLLDYDDEDREECTFELSLFAEVYQEMLQHKMGSLILADLEMLRETSHGRKRDERKRSRLEGKEESLKDTEGEGSSSRKRNKFSDKAKTPELNVDLVLPPAEIPAEVPAVSYIEVDLESKADSLVVSSVEILEVAEPGLDGINAFNANSGEPGKSISILEKSSTEEGEEGAEGVVRKETTPDKVEENGDARKDDTDGTMAIQEEELGEDRDIAVGPPETAITTGSFDVDLKDSALSKDTNLEEKVDDRKSRHHLLSKEVFQAYRYFDRNRVGYLKADDMRRILHSLGRFMSHRNVKELVACAVPDGSKARDERIVYKNFTDLGAK